MSVIAFYTLGDRRTVAPRRCRRTQSDMYRVYAQQVGGPGAQVWGSATVADALAHVNGVARDTVRGGPGVVTPQYFTEHPFGRGPGSP